MKRSPIQWFKCWESIIKRDQIITRIALSEVSGASIWIIKSLQRDFLDWSIEINYNDSRFEYKPTISLTLREDIK